MERLSIFPLQLVVYPGEEVALHIFEPRYVRLINDCLETGMHFGLVPVHNEQITRIATAMQVTSLHQRYTDGRMDIRTQGMDVLRILEYYPSPEPDVAHQATVERLPLRTGAPDALREEVTRQYRLFHELINTIKPLQLDELAPLSFQIGHTSGLEMDKQAALLELPDEVARLNFLQLHFDQVIPALRGIALTRTKIQQNGHFKTLPPADLRLS
ncbi:MAG: LON peptidase substrate-binding domain-containing protein [Bacteroidetes bacterium]|nr:LON peptidase substrate-binding domain-containing protein [Bacteroidota bacterium]